MRSITKNLLERGGVCCQHFADFFARFLMDTLAGLSLPNGPMRFSPEYRGSLLDLLPASEDLLSAAAVEVGRREYSAPAHQNRRCQEASRGVARLIAGVDSILDEPVILTKLDDEHGTFSIRPQTSESTLQ